MTYAQTAYADTTRRRMLRQGFTIIEIGVVVFIIGILASIMIPAIYQGLYSARKSGTETALRNVNQAIEEYKQHTKQYPETLYDLLEQPENVQKWRGPYIKEEMLYDAWNDQLQYERTPQGEHPYELYSWGGQEGSPEDQHISIWKL